MIERQNNKHLQYVLYVMQTELLYTEILAIEILESYFQ